MKNTISSFIRFIFMSLATCLAACSLPPRHDKASTRLYFDRPAAGWHEAIPIGNGRLGGMVYGGTDTVCIRTNDDTFWSGEPRDLQQPGAYRHLPEIRRLLLEGKNREAQQSIDRNLLGEWNQSYLPFADIVLRMPPGATEGYSRVLDLKTGTVTVGYRRDGVNYTQQIFASYPDQAIVIRLKSDRKGSLNFHAALDSPIDHRVRTDKDRVILSGRAPKHVQPKDLGKKEPVYEAGRGMRFQACLRIAQTDGRIGAGSETLELSDATSATLVFVGATSYNGCDKDPFSQGKDEQALCAAYLKRLDGKSYQEMYDAHVRDYAALFNRVSLDLGTSADAELPLDVRIKNYRPGADPALTALYYQFGRYLLIASSRPGSQAANLQGIWNKDMQPAWCSNWTINCNTEINYWIAEPGNLSECHLPLMELAREATIDGSKTARNLYNARGWTAHHNLDLWKTTWPVGGTGLWAIYQVGGAWLCQHIWEHYRFTGDRNFLKTYYPVLKEAALFYLDNLQTDRDGYLVTNPSESFENSFRKPGGETGWACIGAAQDMQIIRSLFKNTLAAAALLADDDEAFRQQLQASYGKLAPMKISPRTGRLQEWNDDWEPASPHNGQVAHGWGFVASDLITLRGTPELAQAFRKTLEYRKPEQAYNSGSWTGAFPANFWARFEEGDSVQKVIDRHFRLALFPNLTSRFFNTWEIDGNLGMAAAIGEMLMQSHAGEIALLPALPAKYPDGSVKGLKARGNYEVDIVWQAGKLTKAIIRAGNDGPVRVRYKDKVREYRMKKGESVVFQ